MNNSSTNPFLLQFLSFRCRCGSRTAELSFVVMSGQFWLKEINSVHLYQALNNRSYLDLTPSCPGSPLLPTVAGLRQPHLSTTHSLIFSYVMIMDPITIHRLRNWIHCYSLLKSLYIFHLLLDIKSALRINCILSEK